MSFSKALLPTEAELDERQQPPEPERSISLEDAMQEYVKVDARLNELNYERRGLLEILLPHAFEVRGTSNTTRLDSSDQKVQLKIEFKQGFKCDTDLLNTVREMLGDDKFEDFFKVAYEPKLKSLRPFLASKSTDERIETAKDIIRQAVTTVDRAPYVTIEKGRIDF